MNIISGFGKLISLSIASSFALLFGFYELNFNIYINRRYGNKEVPFLSAEKLWNREWRYFIARIIFAVCIILLTWLAFKHIIPAWWILPSLFPFSIALYRILFRYNFHMLADMVVTFAAILLFAGVLSLSGSTENLFDTALNGTHIAELLFKCSPVVSGSIAVSVLIMMLSEAGKDYLSNSKRYGVNAASEDRKRLQRSRQIILENRRSGFYWIVLAVFLCDIILLLVSFIDMPPEDNHALPLQAYIALFSALFSLSGFFLSVYMSDETLIKAERFYLGYISYRLYRLSKAEFAAPKRRFLKPILNYYSILHQQKSKYMWADFRQVFLHLCYSAKEFISNEEYEETAAHILHDMLKLRYEKSKRNRKETLCPARDSVELIDISRIVYESYFAQSGDERVLERQLRLYAETFSLLLSCLRCETILFANKNIPNPMLAIIKYHDILAETIIWPDNRQLFKYNSLSADDLYEISFSNLLYEQFHMRFAHQLISNCPLAGICNNVGCRGYKQKPFQETRFCRFALLYPLLVSNCMLSYAKEGIETILDSQAYSQYLTKLASEDELRFIYYKENSNYAFSVLEIQELSKVLYAAKGEILFKAFRDCLEHITHTQELGQTNSSTECTRTDELQLKLLTARVHYAFDNMNNYVLTAAKLCITDCQAASKELDDTSDFFNICWELIYYIFVL